MRQRRFEYTPFLFVTPSFICGIIYGYYSDNFWVASSIFCGLLITSLIIAHFYKRNEFVASVLFACIGFLLIQANSKPNRLDYEKKHQYVSEIVEIPTLKGRYWRANALVLAQKDSNIWTQKENLVQLNVDTTQTLQVGDIITYKSKTYSFDSVYKNYYSNKEIYGKQYAYKIIILDKTTCLRYQIATLRDNISRRISDIDTSKTQATAIMQSVTVGDKRELSYDTKNYYKNAGVSHLLAISGLHVGIIYAILNTLLFGLRGSKRGRYTKFAIEASILWAFATLSGFSPSVLRAVIMFTMFSLGEASFERKNSLNILLASAFIILTFDPKAVFDISFQLSYLAMIGIITLYKPIVSLIKTRSKIGRWVWQMFVITTTAQITTVPVVLYYFKQFSLLGYFVNYIVWFTIPIIIVCTLIFILTNIHFIGIVGMYVTDIQNIIIEYFSNFTLGIIKISNLNFGILIIIYIVTFALITTTVYWDNHKNKIQNKTLIKRILKSSE